MKSPEGAVLNELGDVISDAALYLPFALVAGVNAALVVLVVIAAIIGEMAGALGPLLGGQRRYDGPLGKSDRAFAFGTLGFLIGIGIAPGRWTTVILAVLLALSALTMSTGRAASSPKQRRARHDHDLRHPRQCRLRHRRRLCAADRRQHHRVDAVASRRDRPLPRAQRPRAHPGGG